jgi:hypothetical protein
MDIPTERLPSYEDAAPFIAEYELSTKLSRHAFPLDIPYNATQ